MSILQNFYLFLTSDDELNDSVRQGGRERLRELVGNNIALDRQPRDSEPVGLTLSRRGGIVHSAISSPAAIESPIVRVSIFARDQQDMSGAVAIEETYDALRDLLPQYSGEFGEQTVQTISQESEPFAAPIAPEEGRDNWKFHYVVTYMIGAPRVVPTGAN